MRIAIGFIVGFLLAAEVTARAGDQPVDPPACVSALRETLSRPGWNQESITAHLEWCLAEGKTGEAEKTVLQLHDATENESARAALIGPLAWLARAGGSIAALRTNFTARRDAHLDSASGWLELAVIEGVVGDSESQRKCLVRAGELDPHGAALLETIVERQESRELWQEAVSTLRQWRSLYDTPQILSRLACLELFVGDDLHGWELAEELASRKGDDSAALGVVVEAVCELREWERAATLLEQGRKHWPDDWSLRCLQAVVLEELGQDEAAVAAHLRILGCPRDAAFSLPRSTDDRGRRIPQPSENQAKTPDGLAACEAVAAWKQLAFAHRRNMPLRGGSSWGWQEPPANLNLPISANEARAFALAHLADLVENGAQVPQDAIVRELTGTGNQRLVAVSSFASQNLAHTAIAAALLRDHPGDQALFAWWLGSLYRWSKDPADVAALKHCVEMFAEHYPALAFSAAMQLARPPGPEQEPYQERALALFKLLDRNEPALARSLAYNVDSETKTWKSSAVWRDAALAVLERGAAELPEAWTAEGHSSRGLSRYECALGVIRLLIAGKYWDRYARFLDGEAQRQVPVNFVLRGNPYGPTGQGSELLGNVSFGFPNLVLRWPQSVIGTLGVFYDAATRASGGQWLPPDAGWVEHLRDPRLKIVAQWRTGDRAAAEAEMARRLRAPGATMADWWLGAWLALETDTIFPDAASEQRATRRAAERLARAAEFPAEGLVRTYVDAALLRTVLALRDRPPALIEAAHAAARRLCEGSLPSEYEHGSFMGAFNDLGFTAEVTRIAQVAIVLHPSESQTRVEPRPTATTLERYRQRPYQPAADVQLPNPAARAVAVRRSLRWLHRFFPEWPIGSVGRAQFLQTTNLLESVAAAAAPPENATARQLLRAGYDFELLGQPNLARGHYEAALRLAPQLHDARARMVLFLTKEHPDEAANFLEALPDAKCEPVIQALAQQAASDRQDTDSAAATDLLVLWMKRLTAAGHHLPGPSVLPIQSIFLHRQQFLDALTREALGFQELADDALARLGEEAMRQKQPLTKTAVLAKDLFRAKASWGPNHERNYGYYVAGTKVVPDEARVEHPNATLLLIWDAWQRQRPEEVEIEILPLLRRAGATDDDAIRTVTALFFSPPDEFLEAARRFVRSERAHYAAMGHSYTDRFASGGTLDFVTLVWRLRQLQRSHSLEDLFLAQLVDHSSELQALSTYVRVAEYMNDDQKVDFVRKVRDRLVDKNPERRRFWFAKTRGISPFQNDPERWARKRTAFDGDHNFADCPAGVRTYVQWLEALARNPVTRPIASAMASVDGVFLNYK